jgi:hypothetical protein
MDGASLSLAPTLSHPGMEGSEALFDSRRAPRAERQRSLVTPPNGRIAR